MEKIREEVNNSLMENAQDKIDAVERALGKMGEEEKEMYNLLQNESRITSLFPVLRTRVFVEQSSSIEQREASEEVVDLASLNKEQQKAVQAIQQTFNYLTQNLPTQRNSDNTDHRITFVRRRVGTNHSGIIKYDTNRQQYMDWKLDIKNLSKNPSTREVLEYIETLIHEVAHQGEVLGRERGTTHDEIFSEQMRFVQYMLEREWVRS